MRLRRAVEMNALRSVGGPVGCEGAEENRGGERDY